MGMTAGEWALWVMAASSVVIAVCFVLAALGQGEDEAPLYVLDEYQDFSG